MIEYIHNPHTRKLHTRVDGATRESCNVDQIKDRKVYTELPDDVIWYWCSKCRHLGSSAGESTGGVAQ